VTATICESSAMMFAEARLATAVVLLDGEIVDANRSTSDLFGVDSPSCLWNHTLGEWIPSEKELSQLLQPCDRVLRVECSLRRSNGESRTVIVSAWMLHPDQTSIAAKEIVLEDITERRALELQLQQSQKMEALGRLAGGVAHDFNNLLMVIRGTCELIVLRHNPDEALATRVQVITRAADQGAQLTRQLLAFSRRQILQPAEVLINESLRDFQKMLAHLIGEDVEVKLELCDEPLATVIDGGQLNQVLLNIAVNARDAMPGGGRLTFRTSACTVTDENAADFPSLLPGDYIEITSEDTGCGIPQNTLLHIFEPFYTTKSQGTGLGLSTAYGILKQSHGGIRAESEVGKGSTFYIYLPALKDLKPVESSTLESVSSKSAAKILIVEDEEMVRRATAEFLQVSGFEVLTAADGVLGLEVMSDHGDVDLVITDVVMPRMKGTEMAAQLRREYPDIPILFITGYTQIPVELAEFEGAAILHKPFALSEITRSVQSLLGNKDRGPKKVEVSR
jgi:two-component system, cell cycle sensor histidine kinase and response regulator CckA